MEFWFLTVQKKNKNKNKRNFKGINKMIRPEFKLVGENSQ